MTESTGIKELPTISYYLLEDIASMGLMGDLVPVETIKAFKYLKLFIQNGQIGTVPTRLLSKEIQNAIWEEISASSVQVSGNNPSGSHRVNRLNVSEPGDQRDGSASGPKRSSEGDRTDGGSSSTSANNADQRTSGSDASSEAPADDSSGSSTSADADGPDATVSAGASGSEDTSSGSSRPRRSARVKPGESSGSSSEQSGSGSDASTSSEVNRPGRPNTRGTTPSGTGNTVKKRTGAKKRPVTK